MRKEIEIKIEEGRDAGKVFKITEMPAFQMDRWATRALIALGKAQKGGITALGALNFQDLMKAFSELDYDIAEPLLQELLECCAFVKDGTAIVLKKDFVDDIIEDWTTIFRLRVEALKLCLGFLEEGDGLDTK